MWNWHTAVYRSSAMQADALKGTHPIYTRVEKPSEAEQNFDEITYEKGSSVLRMLEQYLGEDVFRSGMRAYMQAHKYGNASGQDLWDALAAASGQPVGPLMKSWIEQPGFPVVSTAASPKGIVLEQRRFFSDPDQKDDARWNIRWCPSS